MHCNASFTTREMADLSISIRVKSGNGPLEAFLRDELFISIFRSLSHRKTALNDARALTDTIINKLLAKNAALLTKKEIIESSLEILNNFDKASGTYYYAHHLAK